VVINGTSAECFHGAGVVQIYEPAFDSAFPIGGNQIADSLFYLCNTHSRILCQQRSTMAHNDLVIHGGDPMVAVDQKMLF
jgi:hypothetical protein